MGIRTWLENRRKRKAKAEMLEQTMNAVMRHLVNGGKFEDLSAYCVESAVWWSKELQSWMITCSNINLKDGDRVFLMDGRGGMQEFGNISGSGVEAVDGMSYVVIFGADHRAGLGF